MTEGLHHFYQQIDTDGGTSVSGNVNTGRDFIGRDQHIDQSVHHHYHGNPPLPTDTTKPRGIFGQYPFNERFFGRDDELATLHNLLQHSAPVSICPVITGMGGLGKTQLAVHYARRYQNEYPDGVFWVNAADLNGISGQLADFCIGLDLPVADPQRLGDLTEQKIKAFKSYLDNHPHALLIFDNVEEPNYLRTRQVGPHITALTLGGKLIITTRRRNLPDDKFSKLALQRLLPDAARQILTSVRADLATDPDLDRLCAHFGYLPLMLNLAAAALKKRSNAPITAYLQKLEQLGAEKLHSEVAKVSLNDYHKSLTAVLTEQWNMVEDENARLLFRVAGQLPEAAVIPMARLGLLAGLSDEDEWERPLSDGLEQLSNASLIEVVDEATLRLHPLVRDFAEALTTSDERTAFRTACAQWLADAYCNEQTGAQRLGSEYAARGISALLVDLSTAIDLAHASTTNDQSSLSALHSLLRHLRLEADKLQGVSASWRTERLWQQLLPRTPLTATTGLTPQLVNLLQLTWHWLPQWGHQRQASALEQTLIGHEAGVNAVVVLDDQRIVSASNDRTLKVWNLQTGQVIASIELDGAPQCIAVARQGERTLVVVGDAAGSIYCLELVEGQPVNDRVTRLRRERWALGRER